MKQQVLFRKYEKHLNESLLKERINKMDKRELKIMKGFYSDVLTNELLKFWLPECVDKENGGFVNCYTNDGKRLISKDKYTWSQGRFVWLWSKLASMESDIFTDKDRSKFLELAKNGRDFLYEHCLLGKDDWRCTFLMDETGKAKYVNNAPALDMSISADCFVVLGFARYVNVTKDIETWEFTKKLYASILERYKSGKFYSLPYPLSSKYRAHGKPMMLTCLATEMFWAAEKVERSLCDQYKTDTKKYSDDIFEHFVDKDGAIREVIRSDNTLLDELFGEHINPGHTIEDMWFQLDAVEVVGNEERVADITKVAKHAYEIGWDKEFGGFLHFAGLNGGEPTGKIEESKDEAQMPLVLGDWGSKLWWVHSEALYTSLRLYDKTKDEKFLEYYYKTEEYAFRTFPNPDRNIREWIQIRTREGVPQDKVVALPVKDPFHIIRNVTLIIELLERMIKE